MRTYQNLAFRAACLVGGPDEAEDAVQEAFVKGYRALSSFRQGSPFRPWLLRIVTNEVRNRHRARGRRTAMTLRVIQNPPADTAPSPEVAVLVRERREVLAAAVGRLRDEDRLVVTCRYLLELSESETAQTLGLPAGTVKSRLARSLRRLRVDLAQSLERPIAEIIQ